MTLATVQRWENRGGRYPRYYQVWVVQDLLGDCVLTKAWGRLNDRHDRVVRTVCADSVQAAHQLRDIARRRRARGYHTTG